MIGPKRVHCQANLTEKPSGFVDLYQGTMIEKKKFLVPDASEISINAPLRSVRLVTKPPVDHH